MTRRPRLALAPLALALAVGLAGCGSEQVEEVGQTWPSEAAATVGDHTVTVGDVQEATKGTNAFIREQGGQQQLTTRDVLSTLMFAPQIIEAAQGAQAQVPTKATVERVLRDLGIEPSAGTVEFIRAQSVREQLTPEQSQQVAQLLGDADVRVNPRYGTFSADQGLTQGSPDWLEPLPEQDAQQQAPQQQAPGAPEPTPAP